MAEQFTGDFRTVGTMDGSQPVTRIFDVEAGSAGSIAVGDLVTAGNAGYVAKGANGAANSVVWIGKAVSDSNETASANGTVEVEFSPAGLIVRGKPTTAGNLAQAIIGTKVTLDVSSGTQTVDENDTTNGILTVLDYDNSVSGEETIDIVVPFTYVA